MVKAMKKAKSLQTASSESKVKKKDKLETSSNDQTDATTVKSLTKKQRKKQRSKEAKEQQKKQKGQVEAGAPSKQQAAGTAATTPSSDATSSEDKRQRAEAKKLADQSNPLKVFVGGLSKEVSRPILRDKFDKCGTIERLDMPFTNGRPAGTAFIYFVKEGAVEAAELLHGIEFHGRKLRVVRASTKKETSNDDDAQVRTPQGTRKASKRGGKDDSTTIFVGGLPYGVDETKLRQDFGECGGVKSCRMVKNADGLFKGIAFIVFADEDGVEEALKFNGEVYEGRAIRVCRSGEDSDGRGSKGKVLKGKGKGKDKDKGTGKGKGKGSSDDARQKVCHAFKEGKCPFGDSCHFLHAES